MVNGVNVINATTLGVVDVYTLISNVPQPSTLVNEFC